MRTFSLAAIFYSTCSFPKPPLRSLQGCPESEQQNVACPPKAVYFFWPNLSPSLFCSMNSLVFFCPTVLFALLPIFDALFQTCFTFPLILLYVQPCKSFASPSPSYPCCLPPPYSAAYSEQKKAEKKWSSEPVPSDPKSRPGLRQKDRKRQQIKNKKKETGRKAQHQLGFSFVKQEVWGTKG